ncbi:MAG: biotin/lipoyl-binding protein [Verrucomicrobiae bacterium]|nr:biotin/lipoyl-binding protein [Verrucomicrobiae bacterium]
MIKRLRVTVDGNSYDVTVELPDETSAAPGVIAPPLPSAPAASAPAAPASPPPAAAPAAPAAAVAAAPAASGPAGPGDVPSPLAGRVTAVVVAVGQEVKEGDHLITLEAMKMNTFVFAPKSGKVTEVKTAVGATVEEGQALVSIG